MLKSIMGEKLDDDASSPRIVIWCSLRNSSADSAGPASADTSSSPTASDVAGARQVVERWIPSANRADDEEEEEEEEVVEGAPASLEGNSPSATTREGAPARRFRGVSAFTAKELVRTPRAFSRRRKDELEGRKAPSIVAEPSRKIVNTSCTPRRKIIQAGR